MRDQTTGSGLMVLVARKSMGLTQRELALKVGISSAYLSLIERGLRVNVGADIITLLVDKLELRGTDNEEKFYIESARARGVQVREEGRVSPDHIKMRLDKEWGNFTPAQRRDFAKLVEVFLVGAVGY